MPSLYPGAANAGDAGTSAAPIRQGESPERGLEPDHLRVVSDRSAPERSHAQQQTRPFPPRFAQRAELVGTLAAHFGLSAVHEDLMESFADQSGADVTPAAMARALRLTGLEAEVQSKAKITPKLWPALAYMTSGHVVLVLEQNGTALTLYSPAAEDGRENGASCRFRALFCRNFGSWVEKHRCDFQITLAKFLKTALVLGGIQSLPASDR